jgi:HKD family nuclease
MNEQRDTISGLFPESRAVVIGLPPKFTVLEELEQANHIRLATAFGHMSGWGKLEPGFKRCKGRVDVMTGLDFFQTEPALLRAWNRARGPRFRARLMTSKSGIFHPKVLIVFSPSKSFALVGSGNLSEGGLKTNIECSVYTGDEAHLRHLANWFDGLFERGEDLADDDIREYESKYKHVNRAVSGIHRQQRALEKTISNRHAAPGRYWVIADGDDGDQSDNFYRDGVVRITGRSELGDLQRYDHGKLELALKAKYPDEYQSKDPKTKARLCYNFAHEVAVGHGVFLRHGVKKILGFGIAEESKQNTGTKPSPYFFDESDEFKHALKVHWKIKGTFPLPNDFRLSQNFIAPIEDNRLDTLKAAVGLGERD